MRCHDIDLGSVVSGLEHTPAYERALSHLEECDSCRKQLDRLYASDFSSCEVTSILRKSSVASSELPEWNAGIDDLDLDDHETIYDNPRTVPDIESLQPPVHPELLGRLGRYDVERVVGVGGMATVFKAYDSELHRIVALKVLTSHLARFASGRQRFAREARAAAAILHPNVLPIYNVEANERTPYLVMQFVSGCSLQTRIEMQGPLPIDQVLRIAAQTAAGLAAAHQQGLVHRDVKPSNILLEEETDRVVLSDFGLARTADDAAITCTGIVAGTPRYMSPEQAAGEAIDHRSDLFSLGSVIYFMLTAQTPFGGSSAVSVLHRICNYQHEPICNLRPDVPAEVEQLVDRLLAKKPSQRLASAAETEKEIERLLALWHQGKLRSRRVLWPYRTSRRVKLIAIATCGLSIIAFAAILWNFNLIPFLPGTADPTHLADSDGRVISGPGFQNQNSRYERPPQRIETDDAVSLQRLASSRSPLEAIQAIYSVEGFENTQQNRQEMIALQYALQQAENATLPLTIIPQMNDRQFESELSRLETESQLTEQLMNRSPLLQSE
jgi:serine/threonine protein kinase